MPVLAMSGCFKPFIKKLNSYLQLAATYLLHIDWSFFLGPNCADCDVAKSANDSTSKLLMADSKTIREQVHLSGTWRIDGWLASIDTLKYQVLLH